MKRCSYQYFDALAAGELNRNDPNLLCFTTALLAKSKPEPINLHAVQFGLHNHKNQTGIGGNGPLLMHILTNAAGTVRIAV